MAVQDLTGSSTVMFAPASGAWNGCPSTSLETLKVLEAGETRLAKC